MEVGIYTTQTGFGDPCLLISAEKIINLTQNGIILEYKENEGCAVIAINNISTGGTYGNIISDEAIISKIFFASEQLKEEENPGHIYIDNVEIDIIISFKEYSWL